MMNEKEAEILLKEYQRRSEEKITEVDLSGDSTGNIPSEGISPIEAMTVDEIDAKRDEFRQTGLDSISRGELACVLLAGGMGTRLGYDGPKGTLDIGLTHPLYIFERHIECLKNVLKSAPGAMIPLYIMTSEKNDQATREFFREHDYFGYPEKNIRFFIQETAPACDYDGRLLFEGRTAEGELIPSTSPNGNGGWFSSLKKYGYTDEMKKAGVKWINVFGVDNVLAKTADPVFLGAVIESKRGSGSKVVRKVSPEEKVGVLCRRGGHPSIVEYFDLSRTQARQQNPDGTLTYGMGVIVNYIFSLQELSDIAQMDMPVHRVEKKIPYIDENGTLIKPDKPNGYKFEILITDLLCYLRDNLPFEVRRSEEFAPVKNLHGTDSLDSARELLRANGVTL